MTKITIIDDLRYIWRSFKHGFRRGRQEVAWKEWLNELRARPKDDILRRCVFGDD